MKIIYIEVPSWCWGLCHCIFHSSIPCLDFCVWLSCPRDHFLANSPKFVATKASKTTWEKNIVSHCSYFRERQPMLEYWFYRAQIILTFCIFLNSLWPSYNIFSSYLTHSTSFHIHLYFPTHLCALFLTLFPSSLPFFIPPFLLPLSLLLSPSSLPPSTFLPFFIAPFLFSLLLFFLLSFSLSFYFNHPT